MPHIATIGDQVANARRAQQKTQATLSAEIGICRDHLSRLERGVINPSLRLLRVIADHLGVPLVVYPLSTLETHGAVAAEP